MSWNDWFIVLISAWFIICGVLGMFMYLIWITITFKIKVYDLEYLYGRTAARIIYITIGAIILIYHFYIKPSLGIDF
jgi:hypothetical protein